jgi:IS30 family transposase
MSGRRLSLEERVRIETLWGEGRSLPEIATRIGRHHTTVWRELRRNNSHRHGLKNPLGARQDTLGRGGVYRWGYQAGWAQQKSRLRALRPKQACCAPGGWAREPVLFLLGQRHSPKQIAARLREDFPDVPEMWVSHETIYQAIYVQGRGALREELGRQVALRSGRAGRRPRKVAAGAVRSARAWTGPQFHISQRPAEAADRAVPGHWEGDLLIGARGSSAIVTLVERTTRYCLLGALPDGRASEAVIEVLATLMGTLPEQLRASLVWDNGQELAQHARFTVATGCPVFFCDPHSPWQRGSNENTNGLLRQYFPKGQTDFRNVSQAELAQVARSLNTRPRETLGWKTPAQALNGLLIATAA